LQRDNVLSVKHRLALYILAQTSESKGNTVTLPVKESLSSLLGTTQRHLNRVIKELVLSGGITDDDYPSILINDRLVLQEIIDD